MYGNLITIGAVMLLLIMPLNQGAVYGDARFKKYEEDRTRLEQYIEEGDRERDADSWERVVQGGRETLRAEWERLAEEEVQRVLRVEGDTPQAQAELDLDRREALAEWERQVDITIATAEGRWYAERESIIYEDFDRGTLSELLEAVRGSRSVEEWTAAVTPGVNEATAAWEESLAGRLSEARNRATMVPAEARASYEAELNRIEQDVRARFNVERNQLVYRAKNEFITDLMVDTESLRIQSESQSAEAVTERVIEQTLQELAKDEEKILNRETGEERGTGELDVSNLGDNWEAELARLMERGLARWKEAQELLFGQMLNWKENSEEAFSAGDSRWRKAYDDLFSAKETWRLNLEREINEGIENWRAKNEDLNENLDRAQNDFQTYMATLNDQWNSHAAGLVDMTTTGSMVYGDAVDSVEWLTKMVEKYRNTPAFNVQDQSLLSVFNTDAIEAGTRSRLLDRINQLLTASGKPAIDTLPAEGSSEIILEQTALGWFVLPYKRWLTIDIKFLGSTYNQGTAATQENVVENYQISLTEHQYGWQEYETVCYNENTYTYDPCMQTGIVNSATAVDRFDWTNTITTDSNPKRKSAYFVYQSELTRWTDIQGRFRDIITNAEDYMHNRNMEGENGPGFLRNVDREYDINPEGENDPYLMTQEEYEYRLAQRDRDYWARRLEIARAVRDYAYPATGKRESAETTIVSRDSAEEAMNAAQEQYNASVASVNQIVTDLRALQGARPAVESGAEWEAYIQSIEYLTDQLGRAREAMERQREVVLAIKRSVILTENITSETGETPLSFVEKELKEIEEQYLTSEHDLREQSRQYYTEMRVSERISRVDTFAHVYASAVQGRDTARTAVSAFEAIVNGEERNDRIASWAESLEEQSAAIWGENDGAAVRSKLAELRTAATDVESTPAEREAKLMELAAFIRYQKSLLDASFATYTRELSLLEDTGFDSAAFVSRGAGFDSNRYQAAAEQNRQAFEGIRDAMGSGAGNYEALCASLKNRLDAVRYQYGGDNTSYAIAYSAYRWAMTHEDVFANWAAGTARIAGEIAAAGEIESMYDDLDPYDAGSFNTGTFMLRADEGDASARAVLREYYNRGSSIGMLPFLSESGNLVGASDLMTGATYRFVSSNQTTFGINEERTSGRDFATEILEAVNYGGMGAVGRDCLANLKSEEIPAIADRIEQYVRERNAAKDTLPQGVLELASQLRVAADRIGEYNFIINNRNTADVAALVAARTAATGTVQRSLEFMNAAWQFLKGGNAAPEGLTRMMTMYQGLNESDRAYLAGLNDSGINDLLTSMSYLAGLKADEKILQAGVAFVSPDNTLELDTFMDTRYADATEEERQAIREYLLPLNEKRAYSNADLSSGIVAYLESRNLGGGMMAEMRRYALVGEYLSMTTSGDYTRIDPAFQEYVTHLLAADPGYMRYLPEEVKEYVASNRYYSEYYTSGQFLRTDEQIEGYLDTVNAELSFGAEVRQGIASYISDLRPIDTYYGQDLEAYMNGLAASEREKFRRYAYLSGTLRDDSLRNGFDTGVYGIDRQIAADIEILGGTANMVLGDLAGAIDSAFQKVGYDYSAKAREERYARTLSQYRENPAQFASYRNYILQLTEELPENPAPGQAPAELLTGTMLTGEAIHDTVDPGTGRINTIYYTAADPDKSMLGSMILEEMNTFTKHLTILLETSDEEAIPNDPLQIQTIDEFLELARVPGANMTDLVSNTNSLKVDTMNNLLSHGDELSTIKNTMDSQKSKMLDRGRTYELIKGSTNVAALRDMLDLEEVTFRTYEQEYERVETALRQAQESYNTLNQNYVTQMNAVADAYGDFNQREFEYERAYAVWEYANSPYLKQEEVQDQGVTEGTLPGTEGSTVVDMSGIPSPDARNEYARIEAIYNERAAVLNERQTAREGQETLQTLRGDEEYMELRDDLERKTMSYTRVAQTDVQLNEKLGELKKVQLEKKRAYEATKNVVFFNKSDMDEALTETRDKVLTNIIRNGETSVNAFKNGVSAYLHSLILYNIGSIGYMFTHGGQAPPPMPDPPNINPDILQDIKTIYTQLDHSTFDNLGIAMTQLLRPADPVTVIVQMIKIDIDVKNMCNNLMDVYNARQELYQADQAIIAVDGARTIGDLGRILTTSYRLTDDDLNLLYDESTGIPAQIDDEYINLNPIRTEKQRKDADGRNVMARREGTRIYVLDINQKDTGEYYDLGADFISSVRLRDENGNLVDPESAAQGNARYYFNDYMYSTSGVTAVMKENYRQKRGEFRDAYLNYCGDTAQNGTHDKAVMLRDQEALYWNMMNQAVAFDSEARTVPPIIIPGFTTIESTEIPGENRQRTFDGYQTIVREYVSNDNGTGVQDAIVAELMAQNQRFQEQEWQFEQTTFNERLRRWQVATGYIMARGERDWSGRLNDFENQWRRWRVDTRNDIGQGEKEWLNDLTTFNGEMKTWQEDTSKAASLAAVEKINDGLSEQIRRVVAGLDIPDKLKTDINMDAILANALANQPEAGIGVLKDSMKSVNITAGFTDFLNLGLSPALSKQYQLDLKDFAGALKVMQNLRVVDIFNQIIESFNNELIKQNKESYEYVGTDIRPQYMAPFMRDPNNRIWWLQVCSANSFISGKSYELIPVIDYLDFQTNKVAIKPLKGVSGETVDFDKPETFKSIDPGELETYVRIETEHLNRQIDDVFGKEGSFNTFRKLQYFIIQDSMEKAVKKYNAGVILSKQNWYETEDFQMINSIVGIVTGDVIFKGALKVISGLDHGGWRGALLGAVSGVFSGQLETLTAGNAQFDMSWDYEDGFAASGSVQAEYYGAKGGLSFDYSDKGGFGFNVYGGYGKGRFGIEAAIGYSQELGWNGSVGLSFSQQAGAGAFKAFVGVTYSERDGFGAEASVGFKTKNMFIGAKAGWSEKNGWYAGAEATFSGANFMFGAHVGWSEADGFSGGLDIGLGKMGNSYALNAGIDYNFTKGEITGFNAGLNFAGYDAGNGLSGHTGIGMNWSRGNGYNVFLENSNTYKYNDDRGRHAITGGIQAGLHLSDGGRYVGDFKNYINDYSFEEYTEEEQRARENSNSRTAHTGAAAFYEMQPGRKSTFDEIIDAINNGVERFDNALGGDGFITNEQVAKNRLEAYMATAAGGSGGGMSGMPLEIYSLNDAIVAAMQGGERYVEDLQRNMVDMMGRINQELGTNYKTPDELQQAYNEGVLTNGQVMQINQAATQGLSDQGMSDFNRVYGVALGTLNGTVGVSNGSYVDLASGQNIAGMWNGGTVGYRPVPVTTYQAYLTNPYNNPLLGMNPYNNPNLGVAGATEHFRLQDELSRFSLKLNDETGNMEYFRDGQLIKDLGSLNLDPRIHASLLNANEGAEPGALGPLNIIPAFYVLRPLGALVAGLEMGKVADSTFGGVTNLTSYYLSTPNNELNLRDAAITTGIGAAIGMTSNIFGTTLTGWGFGLGVNVGVKGTVSALGNIANQATFNYLYDRQQNINPYAVGWSATTSLFGAYVGGVSKTSWGLTEPVARSFWEYQIMPNSALFLPRISGGWILNEVYKTNTWTTY